MKEIDVLISNIISEFEEFRTNEISKPAAQIFEDAGKIYFYENICDYFKFFEFDEYSHISKVIAELFLGKEILELKSNIIEFLWDCYLSNDFFSVSTFADIEEILEYAACY
jgi:hypothetical protein